MKVCTKCGKNKSLENFYNCSRCFKNPTKNKEKKDTVCKSCVYKRMSENRKRLLLTKEGREKMSQYYKDYYKKNIFSSRERKKRYASTPKGVYNTLNKREKGEIISREDFIKWYLLQKRKCHYCGIFEDDIDKKSYGKMSNRLNIDRKDNSKGYMKGNMVLSCYLCNRVKCDFFTESEMLKIAKIIRAKKHIL